MGLLLVDAMAREPVITLDSRCQSWEQVLAIEINVPHLSSDLNAFGRGVYKDIFSHAVHCLHKHKCSTCLFCAHLKQNEI